MIDPRSKMELRARTRHPIIHNKTYIMEKLEQQLQQREAAYLSTVDTILKMECTNRTKIAMIYRHYVKYQVAIENIVADAEV